MSPDVINEARRQIEICNACRYCEGFCSVFPAITRRRAFSDGDITQLANLCHNCRGCHYACQYTEPHEFALNLPAILAEIRVQSWQDFVWPSALGRLFQRSGVAIMIAMVLGFAVLFGLARETAGGTFYDIMPHNLMVAVFTPVFLLPLVALAVGLWRYWRYVGGGTIRLSGLVQVGLHAGRMKDLSGGHGKGCNFEVGDRYSNARRWFHQAVMYGFLLCFAATAAGTVMHYMFDLKAPYGLFSLPKLLGIPGGVFMVIGGAGLAMLKLRAEKHLGAVSAWGGEMAFILLLVIVAATGLALYAATATPLVAPLLALHLGSVLALFVLLPYSKMAHGFFRLAALVRATNAKD